MKYLIIPDVHTRVELVEKIIKHENADQIIFLGDYFDDWGDDLYSTIETARWFKWSVNQKNRIHLCGNHDLHYWFKDNSNTRCAGYDQFKSLAIHDYVSTKDWEKLKFFYILDNKWLLSHAGLHPDWISNKEDYDKIVSSNLDKVSETLIQDSISAKRNFHAKYGHWFGVVGVGSNPNSPYRGGGLLWCRWNTEFKPIRGIHQIVGHTPQYELSWIYLNGEKYGLVPHGQFGEKLNKEELKDDNSFNVCLDGLPGSSRYAIYEDGNLMIRSSLIIK